ncbi:hypothetical protein BC833DRAFT_647756 [Globomyces pollinis-pini]|nr:hypothetical protein BC833DRAFT_647756 [Globomyces pollinis-pini]
MENFSYENKKILAPMVRVGCLPMRLLALHYGADLVYSPEIIAKKLILCKRIVNKILGTIDYVDGRGNGTAGLVLRIHPKEKNRLVLQLGASNPEIALKAALIIQDDVAAIDLNCGCPKKFSLHDGMGSALLETPDKLIAILEALVSNLRVPVSCKIRYLHITYIRLLDPTESETSMERTIKLLKRIEATKVSAIGIHCRFTHERPRQPAHWDVFEKLASIVESIPIIANGDLFSLEDIDRLKETHGKHVSSFMFARGAQANVSVFRKEGLLPCHTVMREFLKIAVEVDYTYNTVKYTLMQMEYPEEERIEFQKKIIACKNMHQLRWVYNDINNRSCLFEIEDFYNETIAQRTAKVEEDKNLLI